MAGLSVEVFHRGWTAVAIKTRKSVALAVLDYAVLVEKAQNGDTVIAFTELRDIIRVGAVSAAIRIGSQAQPFSFLPDIDSDSGQRLIRRLEVMPMCPVI